jgi:hypothetical protein
LLVTESSSAPCVEVVAELDIAIGTYLLLRSAACVSGR